MTHPDGQSRPEPPVAGDEAATLLCFLERQRATFAWKCGGLDRAGLGATVGASSMTLGGMIKHLAQVEDIWFSWHLHGRSPGLPWEAVDPADHDWAWRSAAEEMPEQLLTLWRAAVARSRASVAEAIADGGLEWRAKGLTDSDGETPTLRYILITIIEEYARHNGHADLIRESVDGLVGQDPPG